MPLTFKTLSRDNVFCKSFTEFRSDNTINFPNTGIAVIYGPNGIGKTSLARALARDLDTAYQATFDGNSFSTESETGLFHVIADQNGRNIIEGSTEDFILGDNIRREYELRANIETAFETVFIKTLLTGLKTQLNISKKTSPLLEYVVKPKIREYCSDLANNRSKGSNIDRAEFLESVQALTPHKIQDYDEEKLRFLVQDIGGKGSVILRCVNLVEENLQLDSSINRIEETSDAVSILQKYSYLNDCVVCDNEIDRLKLLAAKTKSHEKIMESLSEHTKGLIDTLKAAVDGNDPFNIKKAVVECAREKTLMPLSTVVDDFRNYFGITNELTENLFANCLGGTNLVAEWDEYKSLVREKPQLTDEDVLYIEKFVNDCINRPIQLQRDADGNLQLLLGDQPFLNEDRQALRLSNGEQNFISIAFELLKAKKVEAPIVVLDDPISSFDSIFKNKIIYAIAKFLEGKQQILLTHNVDLVKLLEHQHQGGFNLYILNNTEGERNGFIAVSAREQKLLLYLHEFIMFLRRDARTYAVDEKSFLVSLVPFMRSFANVLDKKEVRDNLTSIMHGYGKATVDLGSIYNELFGPSSNMDACNMSVVSILKLDVEHVDILAPQEFPMLNRALCHSLNYLWLRLQVEKALVARFKINTKKHDQLSKMVIKAFSDGSQESIHSRVFLLSRKTLLNEFNHFEQDLNVFQPALDITDTALSKERLDIMTFLSTLCTCA